MKKADIWQWVVSRVRRPILVAVIPIAGCAPLTIGSYFADKPEAIKVGYHTKKDVQGIMGMPYRKAVDDMGYEIYTYIWADGEGNGQKCIIVFNKNNEVMVVEVSP